MKADEVIFTLDSTFNDKRIGDMTFDEVRAVAFQWIIVKKKCDRMTIIDIKNDGSERCIVTFSKEDFFNSDTYKMLSDVMKGGRRAAADNRGN